jgi:NADH dehydrogenase (ubiquinone) 1 alpha subcomplex subunit 2
MSTKYAFTKSLKEVRFLFCQTAEHSAATRFAFSLSLPAPPDALVSITDNQSRSFLLRAYPTMKKNNPSTPIMLREATGTIPKIFVRYGTAPPLISGSRRARKI